MYNTIFFHMLIHKQKLMSDFNSRRTSVVNLQNKLYTVCCIFQNFLYKTFFIATVASICNWQLEVSVV